MVEFANLNAVEAWLEGRPQEARVALAARAVLRALPALGWSEGELLEGIALPILRAIIAVTAVAAEPKDDAQIIAGDPNLQPITPASERNVASAARSAVNVTNHLPFPANWGAASAALLVHSALLTAVGADPKTSGYPTLGRYAAISLYLTTVGQVNAASERSENFSVPTADQATSRDARALNDGVEPRRLFESPLWHSGQMPKGISDGYGLLESFWGEAPEIWSFWRRWYGALLQGEPLPWGLYEQVALIPDDVWDAGPEAVAEEIARIEEVFWAEKLPQAEEIVPSGDGRFDVQHSVTADEDLVSRILAQTEFVLNLGLNTNSGFSEMCVGFKLIRHTLDYCRDDPNTIEQQLRMARDIISRNVEKGAYDDHDALKALVDSLNQHALELRGQHSEVRAAYEVRVQQTLREIDDDTRVAVAEAMREFQHEKATGRLYQDTDLDAETVETNSAVEAQASAIQRTGGRAAVARGIERASQVAKDVDASGGYKATRIGTTGYTIVDMLSKIFGG